jgi:hypothetical protein
MNRILAAAVVAVAFCASASAATAQVGPPFPPPGPPPSVPPVNPPYPGDDAEVILSGQFTPGGTCTLNVGGALPGAPYPGTITGNGVSIPVDGVADPGGIVRYTFTCPGTFVLGATYRLTFADGEFLTFCVNRAGAVASCASLNAGVGGSNLARTGADYVDDAMRAAALAIGAGALALLWRRRRLAVA